VEPGLCAISQHHDQELVVYDDGLEGLFDADVAVTYDGTHLDTLLSNNYLFDDTPLHDPLFGFEPYWPFQQEPVDEPGATAGGATKSTDSSGVARESDGSGPTYLFPEFDSLFFQDDYMHDPPEDLLDDHSVPQSRDVWMDMHIHTSLQIPGQLSTSTTTSMLTSSNSNSNFNPVEPLVSVIDTQTLTSTTSTPSSRGGETQPGKRKRAEDDVENGGEGENRSDENVVCQWGRCGAAFRDLSELRYDSRASTQPVISKTLTQI
jgi:hypothetical protein